MTPLRPLFLLFDAIQRHRAPNRVAGGVVLGVWLGLSPLSTLHWWGALSLVFLFRVNVPALVLTTAVCHGLFPWLEPLFDGIGTPLLTRTPSLHRLWSGLYHAPILTFTRFNHTTVMGALVCSVLLSLPSYFLFRCLWQDKGRWVSDRFYRSLPWTLWLQSSLQHAYVRYNATQPQPVSSHSGLIRWKGFGVLGLVALGGCFYLLFFIDRHVHAWLEHYGTLLNGAQINIGSVKTRLFRGHLQLRRIQITHHVQPDYNLMEIDRIDFHFEPRFLLSKKIIIEKAQVEGVHLFTRRSVQAPIPIERSIGQVGPGLIDRVATRFFTDTRNELKENPLRRLVKLAKGLDAGAELSHIRSQLRTIAEIRNLSKELTTFSQRWQDRTVASMPLATDPAVAASQLRSRLQLLAQQSAQLQQRILRLDDFVDEDITKTREQLALPNLELEDLSRGLLGPKILNALERLGYWIDLSRRRMPKGSRHGQIMVVARPKRQGTSVSFGKMSTYPFFYLKYAEITSQTGADPTLGKVQGKVENLTTDPPILGRPARIKLEADFPGQDVRGVDLAVEIDHTGESARESISFSVDDFPMQRWTLNETPDLKVSITRGRGGVRFAGTFTENSAQATLRLTLDGVDYAINSPYRQLEETLREILTPLYRFEVNGTLSGDDDNPEVHISSEFGKKLVQGLRREYRNQILAIDDNLRRLLLDQMEIPKRDLLQRLYETKRRATVALEYELRRLEPPHRAP